MIKHTYASILIGLSKLLKGRKRKGHELEEENVGGRVQEEWELGNSRWTASKYIVYIQNSEIRNTFEKNPHNGLTDV